MAGGGSTFFAVTVIAVHSNAATFLFRKEQERSGRRDLVSSIEIGIFHPDLGEPGKDCCMCVIHAARVQKAEKANQLQSVGAAPVRQLLAISASFAHQLPSVGAASAHQVKSAANLHFSGALRIGVCEVGLVTCMQDELGPP